MLTSTVDFMAVPGFNGPGFVPGPTGPTTGPTGPTTGATGPVGRPKTS